MSVTCKTTRANVCIPIGQKKVMSGAGMSAYIDGEAMAYSAPLYGMTTVDWEAGLSLPQRGTSLRPMFYNSGNFDYWTMARAVDNPIDGPADNTYNNIGPLFQSMDVHVTNQPTPSSVGIKGTGPNSVAGYIRLPDGTLAFQQK